jgi:hypothetical protein
MRAPFAALVALTFSASALTGCGQIASQAPVAQPEASSLQARAAHAAPASQLAKEFATRLEGQFHTGVTVRGTTVTLETKQGKTIYEFAHTPATGNVRVSSGEYTFELPHAKLLEGANGQVNADVLPALLVPIAIQVGLGAAISVANYWIHHRGDQFKKEEAIKAAVEGMLAALVPITSNVKYAQFLVPVALLIVKQAKSLDYKDLAKSAMDNMGSIVKAIVAIVTDMKTAVMTDSESATAAAR